MRRNMAFAILLAIGTSIAYLADMQFDWHLEKIVQAFLMVTVLLVAKIIIDRQSIRIKDPKIRYTSRKVSSVVFLILALGGLITLWVPDQQALLVSYGIIAAGLAIAMQDVLRNFAGGITIMVGGIFRTGDRIEVEGNRGDVIDIGLLYTTLAELGVWTHGDSNTGRLTIMPNGVVLGHNVNNYTKDNNFVWDELTVRLTYGSRWRDAIGSMELIMGSETKDYISQALEEISRIEAKYLIPKWAVEPSVYVNVTDNWVELQMRYITPVRERRLIRSRIHGLIMDMIDKDPDLELASESMNVTLDN